MLFSITFCLATISVVVLVLKIYFFNQRLTTVITSDILSRDQSLKQDGYKQCMPTQRVYDVNKQNTV